VSVRFALLALLIDGPKYGMQLKEEYEGVTGDAWPLNVGQVYTTLRRLERDGLVECGAGPDERQRDYRITQRGWTEVERWLMTPRGAESPPRDELVTKVLVALRVPGVDVREVIQAHRRQVVEVMQQWTRFKKQSGELDLPFRLTVEAEITRLGGTAKWLDLAERHVTQSANELTGSPALQTRRRAVVRP
jgi:DNA-binding PadR family transcriptional regulator